MNTGDDTIIDPTTPDPPAARADRAWVRTALAVAATFVGAAGYYATLELLWTVYGELPKYVAIHSLWFLWLPALTIHGSDYGAWRAAALVVSMALLSVLVGGASVVVTVVTGTNTVIPIAAGIVAAWAIAIGTIVMSRRRWPMPEVSPYGAQQIEPLSILGVMGRIAALVFVTAGFIAINVKLLEAQINCLCHLVPFGLIGFCPALLIAHKRGGGWKEWAIVISASLFVYVILTAGLIVGSALFYSWDLAGENVEAGTVIIGFMMPGLLLTWLLLDRTNCIARAGAIHPPSEASEEQGEEAEAIAAARVGEGDGK